MSKNQKKKSSQKKTNLKEFKIVVRYAPQEIEAEKQRFRVLCQLIFPHLASTAS